MLFVNALVRGFVVGLFSVTVIAAQPAGESVPVRDRVDSDLKGMGISKEVVSPDDYETLVRARGVLDHDDASEQEKIEAQYLWLKITMSARGMPLPDDQCRLMAEALVTRDPDKMAAAGIQTRDPAEPERAAAQDQPDNGGVFVPIDPIDVPLGPVTKRGSGPINLILVPNFMQDHTAYDLFMDANTARFTMWSLTLPGFGESPQPPGIERQDFSQGVYLDNAVAQIRRLIETENITDPVVLGHGFMVYLAARMAYEHDDIVAGAVALNGMPYAQIAGPGNKIPMQRRHTIVNGPMSGQFADLDDDRWMRNMKGWASITCSDPARSQAYERVAEKTERPVGHRYFFEIMASDPSDGLLATKTPVLVAASGQGMIDSWEEYMTEDTSIETVLLPGAGFQVMDTSPAELGQAIAAFCERVRIGAD